MAVGALEPKFYAALLAGLGLAGDDSLPGQYDRAGWPVLRARLAAAFRGRSQADWAEVFAGTDACVAPVLGPAEAPAHPHNAARGAFIEVGGVVAARPGAAFRADGGRAAAAAAPARRGHRRGARRARLCRSADHRSAGARRSGLIWPPGWP